MKRGGRLTAERDRFNSIISLFAHSSLEPGQIAVCCGRWSPISFEDKDVRVAPMPDFRMAIRKRKSTAFVVAAASPIQPSPHSSWVKTEPTIIDAIFVFIHEHGCQARSGVTNLRFSLDDLSVTS